MNVVQSIRKGLIPPRLTVDEVYALTESGVLREGERFELIDGEIVPMAAKANWHSLMEARLARALVKGLPDDFRLYLSPSITLSEKILLEPDLTVLPKGAMTQEMRGGDLLLVIEVSDSSLRYDLNLKATLYAAHGVREYWVVDAVRQTIRVHRAPVDGKYADVAEYEAHDSVTALLLPGITIRPDSLD